jgi:hypothetical protein
MDFNLGSHPFPFFLTSLGSISDRPGEEIYKCLLILGRIREYQRKLTQWIRV